jgi:phosphohistidine phosphatase
VKRLTLVRHAKSDPALPGQADWDRPLNRRGQKDAPEMARRLRERRLKPDRIFASPAVRAITTATVMAHELKVPAPHVSEHERLYLASPTDLLQVIRELGGGVKHLMVVGHNPGLTEFANRLAADEHIDNIPTCGTFTALYDIDDWTDLDWHSAHEPAFDYPRNAAQP